MRLSPVPENSPPSEQNPETRIVFYHKQSTSARTRFLRLAYGGVCGFGPLPESAALAGIEEEWEADPAARAAVADAERQLGLAAGGLELQAERRMDVQAGDSLIRVLLARFTAVDPPFALGESHQAKFIAITEARGVPPVELSLLRQSYEWIMGS